MNNLSDKEYNELYKKLIEEYQYDEHQAGLTLFPFLESFIKKDEYNERVIFNIINELVLRNMMEWKHSIFTADRFKMLKL